VENTCIFTATNKHHDTMTTQESYIKGQKIQALLNDQITEGTITGFGWYKNRQTLSLDYCISVYLDQVIRIIK